MTYLGLAWMVGSCVVRDAVGPIFESHLVTNLSNFDNVTNFATTMGGALAEINSTYHSFNESFSTTLTASSPLNPNATSMPFANGTEAAQTCIPGKCKFGIHNDMQVRDGN